MSIATDGECARERQTLVQYFVLRGKLFHAFEVGLYTKLQV